MNPDISDISQNLYLLVFTDIYIPKFSSRKTKSIPLVLLYPMRYKLYVKQILETEKYGRWYTRLTDKIAKAAIAAAQGVFEGVRFPVCGPNLRVGYCRARLVHDHSQDFTIDGLRPCAARHRR